MYRTYSRRQEIMRMTRENLLEKFPSWNESQHDIVAVNYGDDPLIHYDQGEYER